jgi:predicted RNase H-like nuclease
MPSDGPPDVRRLLAAAARLGRGGVDVVAVDMPMALAPIAGRRRADNQVAAAFGRAGAGVHSPTPARPGSHGKRLTDAFLAAGFSLAVAGRPASPGALLEVFPLAALVRLMRLSERPAYKSSRTTRYWPGVPHAERVARLLANRRRITRAVQAEVADLADCLPVPRRSPGLSFARLKAHEDMLDAVIAAWVGARYLAGSAEPFGDHDAAIWLPTVV